MLLNLNIHIFRKNPPKRESLHSKRAGPTVAPPKRKSPARDPKTRTGRGPGKGQGVTARTTVVTETSQTVVMGTNLIVVMETGVEVIETRTSLLEGEKSKDDPGNN